MNNSSIKENWEDSSESEEEVEEPVVLNFGSNIKKTTEELLLLSEDNTQQSTIEVNDEEWDFYHGCSVCINCGKSTEVRIIMINSKRIFCYDACLDNENDDEDYDDDYDELDGYDKKLGLSVSCR